MYLQQNKTIRQGIFRSSKAIEATTYCFQTGIYGMPVSERIPDFNNSWLTTTIKAFA